MYIYVDCDNHNKAERRIGVSEIIRNKKTNASKQKRSNLVFFPFTTTIHQTFHILHTQREREGYRVKEKDGDRELTNVIPQRKCIKLMWIFTQNVSLKHNFASLMETNSLSHWLDFCLLFLFGGSQQKRVLFVLLSYLVTHRHRR